MSRFAATEFVERWRKLSLMEQLGNVGSEVERAIHWRARGNSDFQTRAFDRSLELLDLTLSDPRWKGSTLKEVARAREVVCDAFMGDNIYDATPEFLRKYFYAFALRARRISGR